MSEPSKTTRQYRAFAKPLEARAAADGEYTVEGYAANYEEYQLWGKYWERISGASAFEGCDMSDVVLRYDHEGKVFARTSNGTLELVVDEVGLKVVADLSKTQSARDMHEEIKAGLVTKMSYAFMVLAEHDEREFDEDGMLVKVTRVIDRLAKIYDVAPVGIPANDKTEISARSWLNGVIERERRSDLRRKRLGLKMKITKERITK